MDIPTLHNILLHTYSNDSASRNAAEEALTNLPNIRGSLVLLVQIASNNEVQREIRQSAAINLKNLVQKHWEGVHQGDNIFISVYSDSDKEEYRKFILEALFAAQDTSLRNFLAETVNSIARIDYETKWLNLLHEICANIQSGDAHRIVSSLLALRKLVKNYEYKSGEHRGPLDVIVQSTFPMLRGMLQQLQSNNSVEAATMIHLICKIYWSCVQCSLCKFAATIAEVQSWMELLRNLLLKRLPEAIENLEPANQPTEIEQRNAWPWWKIKKWALQIICRFYTRWGNPRQAEPEFENMSKQFRSQIAPVLLSAVLETLSLRKNNQFCTDRVMMLSLTYVLEAVDSSVSYKQLKPHLDFLLFDVVHPVLCLNPQDLELYNTDPHEFVRKNNDMMEDFINPVNTASNLLSDLCTKRGKDCFSKVLAFYNHILTNYHTEPSQHNIIQKEAALHAFCALDSLLTKSKQHKHQLEALIQSHILPEFQNTHGFMRLRVCKLFSGHFMSDIQFSDETLHCIITGMLKCMQDSDLPVRIEAAKTIRHVVNYEHSDVVLNVMRPVLTDIMAQYFRLMDEIGNDEVVLALEQIIDQFSNEIGPYAGQLVEKLVSCFQQFSEAADEDDDACLTAASCLDTINTILLSIHHQPEYYALFLDPLLPVLKVCLSSDDYIEYLESVLDIIGTIAYYSPKVPAKLWEIFPLLFTSFETWACDYITNFATVIDNFVGRDIVGFLNGGIMVEDKRLSFLEMVYNMAARTFANPSDDEVDLIAACRLLYSLLHNCLKHDINVCVPMMVHMVCSKLADPITERVSVHCYGVIGSCFHYNPQLTLSTMEQYQATGVVLKSWLENSAQFRSYMDKKMFVLGLMSLFKIPLNELPAELQSKMGIILNVAANQLKQIIENNQNESDEAESEPENDETLEALIDQGGYNSDEDAETLQDEECLAILRELKREAQENGNYIPGLDDDDDYTSELDNVDEFETFLETVHALVTTNPQVANAFQLNSPEFQTACEGFQIEIQRRTQLRSQSQQE